MATRIVLGAVSTDSVRMLVLSDAVAAPTVFVTGDGSGLPPVPVLLVPIDPGAILDPHLQGVKLYSGQVFGLAAGTKHHARAGAVSVPFRTLAPAEPMSFVVASCFYEGERSAPHYVNALTTGRAKRAAFKLLIGDNVYLDQFQNEFHEPGREVAQLYLRHFWSGPYADVLSTLPTLTTFDDHEFWNNFPDSSLWLGYSRDGDPRRAPLETAARDALRSFQASLNPPRVPGAADWSFDFDTPLASFFVADARTERTRFDATFRFMPKSSIDRITQWAGKLAKPGILVLGQPLWCATGKSFDWNLANARADYDALWRALAKARFDVLVLTGDLHHSRLLRIETQAEPGAPTHPVYELMTSPARLIPVVFPFAMQGSVEFPEKAPWFIPGADPELAAAQPYLLGTNATDTIALVELLPGGPDRLDLNVEFVDFGGGRVRAAVARDANAGWRDGLLQRGRPPVNRVECRLTSALSLRKRDP